MSEKLYFDNAELRARIRNQYGDTRTFAKKAGINRKTLEKRLSGSSEWFMDEMMKIILTMDLSADESRRYFFTQTDERAAQLDHLAAVAEQLTDEELSGLIAFMDEYMTERGQILTEQT